MPPTLPYQTPSARQPNLVRIASKQRGVILCLLAYLALVIASFALPAELRLYASLAGLAASIVAVVFVFQLSLELYSTAVGVLLGILTLIPLVGLIVLLVINSKATSVLKANGVPVGFLGAKL